MRIKSDNIHATYILTQSSFSVSLWAVLRSATTLLMSVSLASKTKHFMFANFNNTFMHEWSKRPFPFKLIAAKGQAYFSELDSYIVLVSLRLLYLKKNKT